MGPEDGLPQRFADEMGRLAGPDFPKEMILAVSGGGDSMAMLYLAAPWAHVMGIKLHVCTVNHNLRAEAPEEAALVARACAELGLYHQVLDWQWDGQGNLQDAGRQGRLDLINRWRGAVAHVLMAHTRDDQAETFLMRLARGSGLDGLSGMAAVREVRLKDDFVPLAAHPDGPPWPSVLPGAFEVLRPLLSTTREELRHYLRVLKIDHADDPTNDDPHYDRVKMRQALPALAELGLTVDRLAGTAEHLAGAREAAHARAFEAHASCLIDDPGRGLFDITYDRDAFAKIERDTQMRLLAAALQYVSLEPYRPRRSALENALERALAGGATTLHGGYVYPHKSKLFICAEYERLKDLNSENGKWRGLYRTDNNDVRPLGEAGAAQLRDKTDLPARVLWPVPGVWDGKTVLSTPRLGENPHWNPEIDARRFARLLTSR
ncbi:MAG: tRNA lysidine(34) synthetase TilS [Pseudomonadota bacterium]